MTDINKLSDYERGEWDCVHGHTARDCDSDEYYRGYGETYAKEANAAWYSAESKYGDGCIHVSSRQVGGRFSAKHTDPIAKPKEESLVRRGSTAQVLPNWQLWKH